ncbi:low molecular weight protein-tyrosine-phosphatase [Streptomyces sp. G45]|uniref:low molecular weight protein-tyrosine-phosphatase n=1 Tax=Streptomyces sp. G45 TaxID=3406627 RepID=UPI003C163155
MHAAPASSRSSGSRPSGPPFSVCFVCTGNICRSPMAASVFRARVREAGLDGLVLVDSAGTDGWHEGEGADPRTVAVLEAAGFDGTHVARQFRSDWFAGRDLVIALDHGHQRALRRLAPTPADAAKVRLLRSYDPALLAGGDLDVPDPYYGGVEGFEECLTMVEAASEGLLDAVREAVEGRAA